MWVEHPHIEKASCRLAPQKTCARMSNRALSWPFTVWRERVSPVTGCKSGSVWTPWYTSLRARLLSGRWSHCANYKWRHHRGKLEHVLHWITHLRHISLVFSQASTRISCEYHPRKQSCSDRTRVSSISNVVSQLNAPFSAACSIILQRSAGISLSTRPVASAVCSDVCPLMVVLTCFCLA